MRTGRSLGTVAAWTYDIWVYDIASRALSRLTTNRTGIRPAGWTSDSRSVIYIQTDSGGSQLNGPRFTVRNPRVVSQVWDGSAPPRELMRINANVFDVAIGPPHTYAAYTVAVGDQLDIWIAPLDTPTAARPFVTTGASEEQPRLSPDGRLLAYASDETGENEVYVRTIIGPPRRVQVSSDGGAQPVWSADGRTLYYRGTRYVMRTTIDRAAQLTVGRRDTLFRDVFEQRDVANYDVFAGVEQLLMIRTNTGTIRAAIMLDWPEFLSRPPAGR
jgi:Tol biopolymer transport system component